MDQKPRDLLICEDILAECRLGGVVPQGAWHAVLSATGRYLAMMESHTPDAVETYMKILQTYLGAARSHDRDR